MEEDSELARLQKLVAAEASDGLKLSNNLQDNPICLISVDNSVPCVVVIWKRYATSTQLRFVHEAIIDLLAEHKLARILGDDTDLPTIHGDDQVWIVQNWMPRAVKVGLRAVATKRPSGFYGRLATETVQSLAPSQLTIGSFDDLDDARQWLAKA